MSFPGHHLNLTDQLRLSDLVDKVISETITEPERRELATLMERQEDLEEARRRRSGWAAFAPPEPFHSDAAW